MATEVATEVYYNEKRNCSVSPWSPKKMAPTETATYTSTSMHESSILNLTTDDENESESALQQSFRTLDDLHQTPLNRSIAEDMFTLDDEDGMLGTVVHSSPHVTTAAPSCCTDNAVDHPHANPITEWTTRLLDTSSTSLRNVTESFVESLCPSQTVEDSAMVNQSCGDVMSRVCDSTQKATSSVRRQVELDFLNILGCVEAPTDDELVQVWPQNVVLENSLHIPSQHRASIQHRAQRIHRLRQETFHLSQVTHNGPPCTLVSEPLNRTKSMDDSLLRNSSYNTAKTAATTDTLGDWLLGGGNLFDSQEDDLGSLIGHGMDPIKKVEEDVLSYDSDPGDHYLRESFVKDSSSGYRETSLLDSEEPACLLDTEEPAIEHFSHDEVEEHVYDEHIPYDGHRARVAAEVTEQQEMESLDPSLQDTMNCTWTLTWHPDGSDDAFPQKPSGVNVWIERGTMLNAFATIVEPKLMWREVYQPELHQGRKLSMSCKSPFSLRLLAICRIIECHELDRDLYPFAKESRSFLVKTCTGQEYLFEATCENEKRCILKSWKLVVARLASLAVVEDMENMALEFFTPMVQNQMLTTY